MITFILFKNDFGFYHHGVLGCDGGPLVSEHGMIPTLTHLLAFDLPSLAPWYLRLAQKTEPWSIWTASHALQQCDGIITIKPLVVMGEHEDEEGVIEDDAAMQQAFEEDPLLSAYDRVTLEGSPFRLPVPEFTRLITEWCHLHSLDTSCIRVCFDREQITLIPSNLTEEDYDDERERLYQASRLPADDDVVDA